MSIPAIPQNFYLQQGNNQTLCTWDIVAGATSYVVQRSTDGVNFSTIATPTLNEYADTTVTLGSVYFYQIASVNSSSTSPFTRYQSCVPTANGEMSLGELRVNSQQRADRLNSNFVTLPEWNSYLNQSCLELYDLLITVYEDLYLAEPVTFTTDGTNDKYALPNGSNYSKAQAFYKLRGVDVSVGSGVNGWATVKKFMFEDRNKYVYPNVGGTIYGVFNLQYRTMGTNLQFIPLPSANQPIRLWYIPRLPKLLSDRDTTTIGISGWLEYVIVDAAIKALQKEESDTSALEGRKAALKMRIEESAQNRDVGQPDTISNSRNDNPGQGPGWNGPVGGF